jgi:hypothetical protein
MTNILALDGAGYRINVRGGYRLEKINGGLPCTTR